MVLLLLGLVDFLEVLVGIHLQLAASSLVASDDAILMKLKCADGPCMVNAALNTMAKRARLVMAADQKHNLLGIASKSTAERWHATEASGKYPYLMRFQTNTPFFYLLYTKKSHVSPYFSEPNYTYKSKNTCYNNGANRFDN